jgi:hypothetical protein
MHGMKPSYDYPYFRIWQIYSGGMLGHGIQMAAQGGGWMAGDNSLA